MRASMMGSLAQTSGLALGLASRPLREKMNKLMYVEILDRKW